MKRIHADCPERGNYYHLDGPVQPTKDSNKDGLPLFEVTGHSGAWSGGERFPVPPAIGTRLRVSMNALGTGTLLGYFVESGYLGVEVRPDAGQRPDWHIRQNGDRHPHYLVFGTEIRPL